MSTTAGRASACLGLTLLVAAPVGAEPADAPAATAAARLPAVPEPDLDRLEPLVRQGLSEARAKLEAVAADPGTSAAELGEAYGELGRLYQAHSLPDPAAGCYRNAEALAPGEFRWPYLLGTVEQETAQPERAAESFRRALRLRPDDAPAKLHLAQTYLEQNQLDLAEPLLQGLQETPGYQASARYGLGRIALASKQYRRAVELLEATLAEQPQASKVHYPLALAYRGLGEVAKAKEHLARYGGVEPQLPDPLLEGLGALAFGVRTHMERALAAVQSRDFESAEREYRAALNLAPGDVAARVKLARVLVLRGAQDAAADQLREALRRAPDDAQANFFMGALLDERGRDAEAVARYRKTLALDPDHGGANFYLAHALLRNGDYPEAAAHYARVVALAPQNLPARLGEALALIRGGADHAQARQRLEDAHAAYPEDPLFTEALVRLLATSHDPEVRDGQRALALGRALYEQYRGIENGEALAMAYAEVGDFEQAKATQQTAIETAMWSGRTDLLPRLNGNLGRYQASEPGREPWPDDDPVFSPGAHAAPPSAP